MHYTCEEESKVILGVIYEESEIILGALEGVIQRYKRSLRSCKKN